MSYFVHKACNYRLILVQTTAYVRYLMAEVDLPAVDNIFKQSWCQHLFIRLARYHHGKFAFLQVSTTGNPANGMEVAVVWSQVAAVFPILQNQHDGYFTALASRGSS